MAPLQAELGNDCSQQSMQTGSADDTARQRAPGAKRQRPPEMIANCFADVFDSLTAAQVATLSGHLHAPTRRRRGKYPRRGQLKDLSTQLGMSQSKIKRWFAAQRPAAEDPSRGGDQVTPRSDDSPAAIEAAPPRGDTARRRVSQRPSLSARLAAVEERMRAAEEALHALAMGTARERAALGGGEAFGGRDDCSLPLLLPPREAAAAAATTTIASSDKSPFDEELGCIFTEDLFHHQTMVEGSASLFPHALRR